MKCWIAATLAGAIAAAAGCSGQPTPKIVETAAARQLSRQSEATVALYVDRRARLLAVSYAIRVANVDRCAGNSGPILGIALWPHTPRFSDSFARALGRIYGVGPRRLTVVCVLPHSPADRAQVRVGDRIEAVNGKRVHSEAPVFDHAAAVRDGPVRLTVRRDGRELNLNVEPVFACNQEAFLEIGDLMLTDRTDGNHFYVTSGFIRFTRNEDELALVVAHEIAHRLAGMRAIRGPSVEIHADHLGLYLAARAGYDISIAPDFWDRVAIEQPWSLSDEVEFYGLNRVPPHGYMPSRAAAIRLVVDEIQNKLRNGDPLTLDFD